MKIFTLSLFKKLSVKSRVTAFIEPGKLIAFFLSFLFVCTSFESKAAAGPTDRTWDGGGVDDNWNTAANWNPNTAPISADGVIFAGSTRTSPNNNNTAFSYRLITFNSGAAAFTLGGNAMTLTGNVTNNSSNIQTINMAMAFTAARTFNAASGDLSIGGVLSGTGGAVIKTGANKLIFSASNTYTGTTTISAGTLEFGAANVLPSTSVVFDGGTLSSGASSGFSETTGTLDLNASSTLALGTGSHTLSFATSNAVGWTAATMLTITGWTGNYTTGVATGGQIFVGTNASGLTSTQLNQIRFFDGSSYAGAQITSSGEIIPAAPSALSYTSPNTFTRGVAITALNPTVSGYAVSYSVSPALPTGLSLNTSTGAITGTPTVSQGAADYTVTATNVSGNTTFDVSIAVSAIITTGGSGNWNSTTNNAPWVGGVVPTAFDQVTILANHNVTVNVSNAVCSSMKVAPTTNNISILTFNSGSKLTVSGTVTLGDPANTNRRGSVVMTAGGELVCEGLALGNAGANTFTAGTGTVELTTTNTLPATIFTTFNNLKISSGTTTSGASFSVGGTLTVNGMLTPGATGHVFSGAGTLTGTGTIKTTLISATALTSQYTISTKTLTNLTVDYAGAGNQSIAATPISSTNYGSLVTSGGSGTKTLLGAVTVNNNIEIGSGTTLTVSGSNFAITLGGDWSRTGTFTQGTGTVTFNGATQNILGSSTTFNNLTISSSNSTTLGVNTSIAGNLTVSTGTLDLATFTANRTAAGGILSIANGAFLKIGGTNSFPANYTTKTLNTTSTVDYYGTNQTIGIETYGNLILSNSGTKSLTFATNTLTVNNDFTISGSASAATGGTGTTTLISVGRDLILTGTSSLTCTNGIAGMVNITRDISIGSGTTFSPNSGSAYTFGGNVTVASTGTLTKTSGASGTILITGLFTVNGTYSNTINSDLTFRGGITNTGTFTAGTGLYTFNNASQALTGIFSIPNVTVSGITVTNNNTLTVGTALSGSGTLLQATGSVLNIGGTSGITGLDASTNANTVNYAASASQTIKSVNYSSLEISGGGNNIKTLNGSNTVSGVLTIASSTVLAYGSSAQTLILSGTGINTLVSSGTIDMSASNAAHVLQIAATSIAAFGSLTNGTGSTIEYTRVSGGQTINALTFNHLKLNNTSGTNIAGGNLVVNGTLTTTSGGILDMGTSAVLSGTLSSIINGGTIKTSVPTATSATPIPGGKTWSGTVEYASTAAQTVVSAIAYNNLIISGASIKTLAAGGVVNSVLTIGTGATMAYGASAQTFTLSGTGANSLVSSGTIDMSASNAAHVLQIAATSIGSFGTLINGTGSTVEYTKTSGGQTINALTFNNLTFNNTSGTNYAGGNIVVNGTLTTTTGGTLDMGSSAILSGSLSTITNNGIIKTSVPTATSTTPIPTGKAWGGTVEYAATTAQTIVSATSYNNLIVSGAGTKSLTANTSVVADLTISADTLDMVTYTLNRASAGGVLTLTNGATLKIGGTNSFPSNYSTHSIGNTSIVKYAGASQTIATLNSSQSYGHLTLSGIGTKTLGGNISLAGNWLRVLGPDFDNNNHSVSFVGSAAATIKAPEPFPLVKDANGSFGGETFSYLIINKTTSNDVVKLLSNISITKTLTFTKGTFDLDTSDVVLVSNATRTADVDRVLTLSNINITYSSASNGGRFIVQRYIGNTSTIRTWRFLTAPFDKNDPITINEAWQGGQVSLDPLNPGATNPYPGFSTHITQPNGTYNPANGFDKGVAGTNGYSIEYFDNSGPTTKLSYPANTNATRLMSQLGWGLFVRGDRGFVLGGPNQPSGNTTLEPKGKINIGTITSTVVANRTNVVGNPYPCQIDMAGVEIGGYTQQDYKLWDPKAFTNYSKTGRYIFFNWNGLDGYDVNNGPTTDWVGNGTAGKVESGEAFLTYSTIPGTTVVFHETDKVVGSSALDGIQSRPAVSNRPTAVPFARLQADLQFYNTSENTFNNISGANAYFNNSFNNAVVLGEDNVSPVSSALGEIRILKNGNQLSTDRQPIITSDDTVFFYISKANQGKHRIVLSTKYFTPNATAILEDKYLNTFTQVAIGNTDTTLYEFDITGDALSNRSDRFMLVLKPSTSGPLPVKFSNVKAVQQNEGITVEWKVENETNVKAYEVERSEDGVHFIKVSSVTEIGSSNYNWLDLTPNSGNNFYRIRMIDQSGSVVYSQIIKMSVGNNNNSISIINNPIEGNAINLQFNNQPSGKYTLNLYNQIGQTIDTKTIVGSGNSWTEAFLLNTSLPKGIYTLEINSPSNKKVTQKIMVK